MCVLLFIIALASEEWQEGAAAELMRSSPGDVRIPGLGVEVQDGGRHLAGYPSEPLLDAPDREDGSGDPDYRKSKRKWTLFVHVIIIGYMLLGLNTVCDVYFTGALEVMVAEWNIKPDVAGATFMAAGGSAPELFTSLIGTCITENMVGFGTIVGSAVFNVLFVVGLCGLAAETEIKLTWWPLFRDCSYYILGLTLLAIFSQTGKKIELWEAIVLFVAYLAYCVLMYNNTKLEALTDLEYRRAKSHKDADPRNQSLQSPESLCSTDDREQPETVDHEVVKANTKTDQVEDFVAEASLIAIPGCAAEAPTTVTACSQVPALTGIVPNSVQGSETTPHPHVERKLQSLGTKTSMDSSECRSGRTTVEDASARLEAHDRRMSQLRGKMRASYLIGHYAAKRHNERMAALFGEQATIGGSLRSGRSSHAELTEISEVNGADHCTSESTPPTEQKPAVIPSEAEVEPAASKEFVASEGEDEEEEEDEGDLMTRPTDTKDLILWYLSLPIYATLYYTIPEPTNKKFPVTFVLSLSWIAAYAYVMVWFVEIMGEVMNVPTIIMGFTVLAAGTSIPDAVSSVAVARMGEGDMAISSSIGSNIFDILVGLPIPWILKIGFIEGLGHGRHYDVKILSDYIPVYVILLLIMVLAVICCIHIIGWKLNKMLGLMMAVLYMFFLACAISVEYDKPAFLKWG